MILSIGLTKALSRLDSVFSLDTDFGPTVRKPMSTDRSSCTLYGSSVMHHPSALNDLACSGFSDDSLMRLDECINQSQGLLGILLFGPVFWVSINAMAKGTRKTRAVRLDVDVGFRVIVDKRSNASKSVCSPRRQMQLRH